MFSKQSFHVVSLSICISSSLFCMGDKSPEAPGRIPLIPRYQPDSSSSSSTTSLINDYTQNSIPDEKTVKDLLSVFENGPEDAREIVDHLKDPKFLSDGTYRSAFFVGEPGTGKTMMARAIAHKMSPEWRCIFRNGTDIVGEHRNQAAINLNRLFADIEAQGQPTILVIDELNQLLEHAESENYDTDATSKILWRAIDRQNDSKNNNFFFIGIMNRDEKIPKPMKSRMLLRTILFKQITNAAAKIKLLKDKIVDDVTQLDKSVNDEFLKGLLLWKQVSGRDFHEIALKLRKLSRRANPQAPIKIITKKHLEQAFKEYREAKIRVQYDTPVESDEERRHKENLAKQEEHFVQAQMLALRNVWSSGSPRTNLNAGIDIFNPEQQKIIDAISRRLEQARAKAGSNECSIQ